MKAKNTSACWECSPVATATSAPEAVFVMLPAGLSGPSAAVSQLEREQLLALQLFVSWAAARAPGNWLSWIMFWPWTLTCPWMVTLP